MPTLTVQPQRRPLTGHITVPGDKSISHRAVLLGAIADGISRVRNWLPAGDTLATLDAVRALGVAVAVEERSPQSWDLSIDGRGLHGLRPPVTRLDCGNAGTGFRLLAGILAGQPFPSVLDGSPQLRRRPMSRIIDPLRQLGAVIDGDNGRAPLHIRPARLYAIDYAMPVASAQVKSAILLAGLYAEGATILRQPGPARDHTERMLAAMGADVTVNGDGRIRLTPPVSSLQPLDLDVPGDLSSAAFPLVAALLVPGSEITIDGVGLNETRTGLLDLLRAMGAELSIANERMTGGEPAGDLTVRAGPLRGTAVAGDLVVRAIDELPILAVAATGAQGTTAVREAAELRVKEVDRIARLVAELGPMGAAVAEHPDGFDVTGPTSLSGGPVSSGGDHRLGMALAVAGLVAARPTAVAGAGCIADSFPGFVETMAALGAEMTWQSSSA